MRLTMLRTQRGVVKFLSWMHVFFIVTVLGGGNLSAAPLIPPDKVIRQVIIENLLDGDAHLFMRETPIASERVVDLVRNHIDSGLIASVLMAEGSEFRFVKPGEHNETHVAVLTLSYRDEKTALKMKARVANDYFKRTKILTLFSCVAVGNQLVVVFTEKAGDEDVVKFIKSIDMFF